ncbi:hypothetical protein [Hyphomonas atlantica]|uniref:Uncharacterized protein n=1 Tax=Hyphomonas atlantica TaxID=1280948 RepID=A0A059DXD7_9PROT|nr:hypothetical protein [Hyphomonas atlantica]KCZ58094.1 hypothetical protein HY36_11345 [Hyphomonas atlantica]
MAKKKDKKSKLSSEQSNSSKSPKETKKAKKNKKSSTSIPELSSTEIAHKIWLAGVGAYGKAYDKAIESSKAFNKQSTELFEELVQQGQEIEKELQARVENSEAGKKGKKLAAKLEKLEEEVVQSFSNARAHSKARSQDLKERISRLSTEIEAVAAEASSDIVKSSMKAAKKTTDALHEAMVGSVDAPAKPSDKSTPKPKQDTDPVDDFTLMTGVGPALAARLKSAGIVTFSEIAALNKAEIEALDAKIMARGRIVREEWVKQARRLMK